MGGFCVGASSATVAAHDSRIREQVKFVNFFGGYSLWRRNRRALGTG